MKIVAILNWFEESPAWLAATITSLAHHVQPDHLVALDGGYMLLNGATGYSGSEQHAVIVETCRTSMIGLTLFAPSDPWAGNEVEKRTTGFKLAELVTEPEDWYMVIDADEVVTSGGVCRKKLAETECDVMTAQVYERYDVNRGTTMDTVQGPSPAGWEGGYFAVPHFFRAVRGLACVGNHYTYETPDGYRLWGHPPVADKADSTVTVEHRSFFRDTVRKDKQTAYYRRRDAEAAEYEPPAVEVVA